MDEQFNLDYLGKDLTGNEKISSMLERGLVFMKLEKHEKALEVFDELIDKYPDSPCGWFAKARLASDNFEFCDLTSEESRHIVAIASDNLDTAMKVIDSDRKADYDLLIRTYSDKMKRALVKDYVDVFDRLVEELIGFSQTAKKNVPEGCGTNNFVFSVISEAIRNAMYVDNENSIYTLPEELVKEISSEYCALSFANMHIKLFEEFLEPYAKAFEAQEYAQQRRDARAQMRSNWNVKQGWGSQLDSSDIAMLDREFPVYDVSYYYKRDTAKEKYSLEKLIRKYRPFTEENNKTYYLENVIKAYEKLYSLLKFPLGNLSEVNFPEEVRDYICEISEKSKIEIAEKKSDSVYELSGKENKQIEVAQKKYDEKRKKNRKIILACVIGLAIYYLIQFLV